MDSECSDTHEELSYLLRRIQYISEYTQKLLFDRDLDDAGEAAHKLASLMDKLNDCLDNHPLREVKQLAVWCQCGHAQLGLGNFFKCNKCGHSLGIEEANFTHGRLELKLQKKKVKNVKVRKTK